VSAGFSQFCHFAVSNQPPLSRSLVDGLRTAAVWLRERRFFE
jgi:hypothetical protein